MTIDEFVTTMRRLKWQEPFQQFIIELKGGRRIFVDDPDGLGFVNGSAAFIHEGGRPERFFANEVTGVLENVSTPSRQGVA